MTSSWLNTTMALASAVVAAVFLVAAARARHDRLACLAHSVMGLGMIGMFAPQVDVVPSTAGALGFAVIGGWFIAQWLRGGAQGGGTAAATHLAVAPTAMVVMYLEMGSSNASGMDMNSGAATAASAHSGHDMAMGPGSGSPLLGAALLVLAGYFLWYAWILAGRLIPARPGVGVNDDAVPAADPDATAVVLAPTLTRLSAAEVLTVTHLVMCMLMAVMFLSSV
ncbi:DUF5134 domain-containing protein [Pseudonocardia sp.]|uniref:DUF5134 domain-containing protein n=1 Tax=Pseudonocardia sp. TaxID=60912 RepID=UPI0031FE1E9A